MKILTIVVYTNEYATCMAFHFCEAKDALLEILYSCRQAGYSIILFESQSTVQGRFRLQLTDSR